ncbi:hypothetical protein FQN57_001805 [Myotisia sp. PD_48]|nr:hypothetical protein FQN57_001805 [Myotisia sp. PD_48]
MTTIGRFLVDVANRRWDLLPPKPKPCPMMFQAFEWNIVPNKRHWKTLLEMLPELQSLGVTSIWIPPACKGMSTTGNGYDTYDLYDVGEFKQKGSISTKWGTKEELLAVTALAKKLDIGIIWDVVLNHRAGADRTEKCMAVEVDPGDRYRNLGDPKEIQAWVGFDFPDRENKYSSMKYHWQHFTGVNYDASTQKEGIFKLTDNGKNWAPDVSEENGNYDYLMFADVDYTNEEVKNDVKAWIEWLGAQFPISGLRLDATKHYSRGFLKEFIAHIRQTVGPNWFLVAEFWTGDVKALMTYWNQMNRLVSLFDVPLLNNFATMSEIQLSDIRKIFQNTLLQKQPSHAVTFVTNHDTTTVDEWFKPFAYALILLRQEGHPCVFYGDLYGMNRGENTEPVPAVQFLRALMLARKLYAHGRQQDYFDRDTCIGWVRYGDRENTEAMACVLCNGPSLVKFMYVGKKYAGEMFTEVYGNVGYEIKIDPRGYGGFSARTAGVSIWVHSKAKGREQFQNWYYLRERRWTHEGPEE